MTLKSPIDNRAADKASEISGIPVMIMLSAYGVLHRGFNLLLGCLGRGKKLSDSGHAHRQSSPVAQDTNETPATTDHFLDSIEMGIGSWQWGDRWIWGYDERRDAELRAAFEACLAGGIRFFDTAEIYGMGASERLLGQFSRDAGQPIMAATKFFPFPWRLRKESLLRALRDSLQRLDMEQIALYQLHFPFPPVPTQAWAGALANVVEAGLAREVGISNCGAGQMRRVHAVLAQRGIHLASNQVEYNLLNRQAEKSGLLALCRTLGVRLIAYSPLAQGLLSGKYTPDNPPPGARGYLYKQKLAQVQPLIALLREVGEAHGGKTPSQVALNWLICKGALPIPGVKTVQQAQQNLGALGWRLSEEEVATLDAANGTIL